MTSFNTSSVWNSVQSNVTVPSASTGMTTDHPTSMLHTQLASALSTLGDAQYWEESIAPSTIRTSLSTSDPSNPSSTPVLLRGMKWLLACMSKGRDVSDFYPHVVKLVGATSLEVRKMVYMYLVQYADHDASTRELSLLSINSFQRGLADNEQWIRALALRVLTSVRISDILQIQILGIQKCARDKSPYVRKCAANALAKLGNRCDEAQFEMLVTILKNLLEEDTSTMVLTSTITAFCELCPQRLDLLHSSYRKICHLLTDMDEWGQVVVIDTLARYCRANFCKPPTQGSAEAIDEERRVQRTLTGIANVISHVNVVETETPDTAATASSAMPQGQRNVVPKKVKRRVVKKGFYSDEEDESTEEEVYQDEDNFGTPLSLATAMRQRNVLGSAASQSNALSSLDEDGDLAEDHRLLLRSSLSLLKSRNSGVVLSVCSLHYYCGVSSIKVRSALGKALVRIHRDRREIQYVVLSSIRTLASQCPSAFSPFLQDFFIKAMDPSFTRMIKLDILASLALEPASIEAVLKELRNYIRHDDKEFVCASIQTIGKVVELARIVHERHGQKVNHEIKERKHAIKVALNSLHGLYALTHACKHADVVGECVVVMEQILLQLMSYGGVAFEEDTNHVVQSAMRRLTLLLLRALSGSRDDEEEHQEEEEEKEKSEKQRQLEDSTIVLPPAATASALWIVGEWLSPLWNVPLLANKLDGATKTKMRLELVRLVAKAFPTMEACEKLQSIHFASKVLVASTSSASSTKNEIVLCEHVLSMGRVDVDHDVRDRARMESGLLHSSIGLKHDSDSMSLIPIGNDNKKLSIEKLKLILLQKKPPPSFLPLEKEMNDTTEERQFRFGTLSSLVSHRARTAYLPLPPWSAKNSPDSIRDPPQRAAPEEPDGWKTADKQPGGFYDSDQEETSSSDEDSSTSEESSSDEDESSSSEEESSSDDKSSSEEDDSESDSDSEEQVNQPHPLIFPGIAGAPNGDTIPSSSNLNDSLVDVASPSEAEESSSSEEDSSSEEGTDEEEASKDKPLQTGNLLERNNNWSTPQPKSASQHSSGASSLAEGLEGLVMAPLVLDKDQEDTNGADVECGEWMKLVRPELGGGLLVQARYLRGRTKQKEAKQLGLDPEKVTTVCLQFKFENRRTDAGILRRIRMIQRGSPSGSISTRRMVVPQEIEALKRGQVSMAVLGMEFASASNRDGALAARLDMKSDRGSNVLDIRPPVGEMLRPCKLSQADFDSAVGRMKGFHQRATSTFTLNSKKGRDALPGLMCKHACLTPLDKTWKSNKFHLVGTLPASGDNVYVIIKCIVTTGDITVCCDETLASASIMDLLKQAVAAASSIE